MIKKLLLAIAAGIIATAGLVGLSVTTASAHGAGQNGCTLSPDWIFHNACDRHDLCYDARSTPNSAVGRKSCDDKFLADMRNICASTYRNNPRSRDYCYGVAGTYYKAVRLGGPPFFKNPYLN